MAKSSSPNTAWGTFLFTQRGLRKSLENSDKNGRWNGAMEENHIKRPTSDSKSLRITRTPTAVSGVSAEASFSFSHFCQGNFECLSKTYAMTAGRQ